MSTTHLPTALFGFLRDLADNNNRDWFQANKVRYRREVQEPLLAFIAAFANPLAELAPRFVADPRPSGGSMFRIYRDVRFSKDKSPYKTHAAAQFRHQRARDVHAPGFYLHLEPDNVFMGAGMWHPDGGSLKRIREAIVEAPDAWTAATSGPDFEGGLQMGGESLKRPPRGFDPDHPLIDDLKRKDFICWRQMEEADATREGFLGVFVDSCRASVPLMRFLTEAVGLEY